MEEIRTYVFDTSYLIEYPEAVNNLMGNLVIPAIVLKQLDGLRNSEKEGVAQRARAASNAIFEAQRSGRLRIVGEFKKVDVLASYADNVIVGTALKIKEINLEIVLLTTDTNMKIAAESAAIVCEINKLKKPVSSSLVPLSSLIISLIISAWFIVPAYLHGNTSHALFDAVMTSAFLSALIIFPSAFIRAWRRGDFSSRGYEPGYKSKEKSNPVFYSPIFSNTKGNIYHIDRDRR
ncbi:MAG: PIN domain-containing protein [Syntrophaceae bacterium]